MLIRNVNSPMLKQSTTKEEQKRF